MIKLSIESLHLNYGAIPILRGVSFDLKRGEIVVLLGSSGSGKTTLLRAIAGFEAPGAGVIRVEDRVVFDKAAGVDVPAEDRNLGLVFQSYALWPHRTVFDNVGFPLKLRGVARGEIRERVEASLYALGLKHLAERFPHQLSGGQQQRVAIARALIYNPPVILLDEPLSNLDAKLRDEAKAWLRNLVQKMNLSAVLVTHDQEEAMALADDVILLSGGCVEQRGSPEDIYNRPSSLLGAEFFGKNIRLEGTIRAEGNEAVLEGNNWRFRGSLQGSAVASGNAIGIVRVERVHIAEGPGQDTVRMTLTDSLFAGERWRHLFRFGGADIESYGPSRLPAGDYWITVPAEHLWIFPSS